MIGDLTVQNRYAGDIGDYLKLAILRALSRGYRLGIAWWLYPDESHNGDGRHIGYLAIQADGGTSIPTCLMPLPRSLHPARGMCRHWKLRTFSPAPSSPTR